MKWHMGLISLLALMLISALSLCVMPAIAEAPESGETVSGEALQVQMNVCPEGAGVVSYDEDSGTLNCVPKPGYVFSEWRWIERFDDILDEVEAPDRFGEFMSSDPCFVPGTSGVYTAVLGMNPTHSVGILDADHGQLVISEDVGFDQDAIPEDALLTLVPEPEEGYELACVFIHCLDPEGDEEVETEFPSESGIIEMTMPSCDLTIHPVFERSDGGFNFIITMDPNGAMSFPRTELVGMGYDYLVWSGCFYRYGYEFTGWNTAPDGNGKSYQPFDRMLPEQNTTLYAQWEPVTRWAMLKDEIGSYGTVYLYSESAVAGAGDTPIVVHAGEELTINIYESLMVADALEDYAFIVEEGGRLALMGDSRGGGGASLTRYADSAKTMGRLCGSYGVIYNEGEVVIDHCVLEGASDDVPAIYNRGTLHFTESCITGCAGNAVVNEGEFYLHSGSIVDNGGTGVVNNGLLQMMDGSIERNLLGVRNNSESLFEFFSGEICFNEGVEVGGIDNMGDLQMEGGSSLYGNVGAIAGGIRNAGVLEGYYASICGNEGGSAGGVYNEGQCTLRGCKITNNIATGAEGVGGVRLAGDESASLTIGGMSLIYNNRRGGASSNIFLPDGKRIMGHPEEGLSSQGYICVSVQTPGEDLLLTDGYTAAKDSGAIFCDDTQYRVARNEDGEAVLTSTADAEAYIVTFMRSEDEVLCVSTVPNGEYPPFIRPERDGYEFDAWVLEDGSFPNFDFNNPQDMVLYPTWRKTEADSWSALQELIDAGGYVRLACDLEPSEARALVVRAGNTVKLDLNGHLLDGRNLPGAIITVEPGAELKLVDSRYTSHDHDPIIECSWYSYSEGALLGSNNRCAVEVGGSFTLSSGMISESCSQAGIHVLEGGTFHMTDGSFYECENNRYGTVYNEGTFTLDGGSFLYNYNRMDASIINNRGSFIMRGGSIEFNYSRSEVVANYGVFEMSGGYIRNNANTECRTIVYNDDAGQFTLCGGIIAGNNSEVCSGVHNRGQFTMTSGAIVDNHSNGIGGIWQEAGIFTLSGGRVQLNHSENFVSGVYFDGGEFRLSGDPFIGRNPYTNLVVAPEKRITVDGDLSDDMMIEVLSEDEGDCVVFTTGLSDHGGIEGFSCYEGSRTIQLVDGEAAIVRGDASEEADIHFVCYMIDGSEYCVLPVVDGGYAPNITDLGLPNYTLNNWYACDENGNVQETPFAFETTPITQDTYLVGNVTLLCSVEFAACGGEGAMEMRYVEFGGELELPECTFTPPEGMAFDCWEITSYGSFGEHETVTVEGDLFVRAQWRFEYYNIIVDEDIAHGTLSLASDQYCIDDVIYVDIMPDVGYEWISLTCTVGDFSKTYTLDLNALDPYCIRIMPGHVGEMTLTATFEMIEDTYRVQVCYAEGEGYVQEEEQWIEAGEKAAEPATPPARRGKIFKGWRRALETEPYDFDQPVLEDLFLVGIWEDQPGYTVNLPAIEHGSVTITAEVEIDGEPETLEVQPGVTLLYRDEVVTYDVQSAEGYLAQFESVKTVDQQDVPVTDNSFVMPEADVWLNVTVTPVGDYIVDPTVNRALNGDGTLDVKTRANAGETVMFTAMPAEGCYLKSLDLYYSVEGVEQPPQSLLGWDSFVMPDSDARLVACFSGYAVTMSDSIEHGRITVDKNGYRAGQTVQLNIQPDPNYYLESLTVKDARGRAVNVAEDYTFLMPAYDTTVEATFRQFGLYYVDFKTGTTDVTIDRQEVLAGQHAQRPSAEATERLGYEFLYWYAQDETMPFNFEETPIDGDITLTAKWERLCAVSFHSTKWEKYPTQYVHSGECATPPEVEAQEGYTMQGWFHYGGQEEPFDFNEPITQDVTVLVNWARNIYTWQELYDQMYNGDDSRYILMDDIVGPDSGYGSLTIRNSYSRVLNLNGHDIDANGLQTHLFYLSNYATLTLVDFKGGGKITGSRHSVVVVMSGAVFNMKGGIISGNAVIADSASKGGVIRILTGGSAVMRGGIIENNTCTGGHGGAVIADGTFNMYGGIIRNNTAYLGGGVYIYDGSMNFYDGVIEYNTATAGGGIYVVRMGRSSRMTGGIIRNNTAERGGGVYAADGSISTPTFRITNGEITGNTASMSGGGIFSYNNGVGLSGTIDITGNALTDGTPSNLYLHRPALGNPIPRTVSVGPLDASSRIGFSCNTVPTYDAPITLTNNLNGRATAENYFSDNPAFEVIIDEASGEAKMILPIPAYVDPDFTLPGMISSIEESAFEGIAAESIYIPDGCVSIGEYAFKDCAQLRQIRIPDSVTSVADNAFEGCSGLKAIYGGSEASRVADLLNLYYGDDSE